MMTFIEVATGDMTDQKNPSPIRLCVMHGDGIGPEITTATLSVLRAAAKLWQIEFAFGEVEVGLKPLAAQGTTFPESAFQAAKAADGVILGPVSHNDYPPAAQGGINPSGALRKRLDLFANIRPATTREGFPARCGSRRRDFAWRCSGAATSRWCTRPTFCAFPTGCSSNAPARSRRAIRK